MTWRSSPVSVPARIVRFSTSSFDRKSTFSPAGLRQRLLSALLLIHAALVITFLLLQPFVSAGQFEFLLDFFGLFYILVLYAISRTVYYRAAAVEDPEVHCAHVAGAPPCEEEPVER